MTHHHLHRSAAVLVCCVDHRFWEGIIAYVQGHFDVHDLDLETLAGAAKDIAAGKRESSHVLFHEIEISKKLHKAKRVFLVSHQDCGAYGSSKFFKTQLDEEKVLFKDLLLAKSRILKQFPDMEVIPLYASLDEDGSVQVKSITDESLRHLHHSEELE